MEGIDMSDSITLPLNGRQIFARIISVDRSGTMASILPAPTVDRAPGIQVVAAQTPAQLDRALRQRPNNGARIANFYNCT